MTYIQNPTLRNNKIKILLLEGISENAVVNLKAAGYTNVERLTCGLDSQALIEALKGVRILGIRSRTQVRADIIAATDSLIAVGCFSVGTNQVDLKAALLKGIPVFNAPFSNTRSVAELTIAEIVMLFRRIFPRSVSAHQGRWEKSAAGSHEIRGKTLGIVGYGNIGSQVAVLAEAIGLKVIYYDHTDKLRHGNAEPVDTLDALLAGSDVVTLHVPQSAATRNMIGAREIGLMKKGAFLINNSRGTVVDLEATAEGLGSGHLCGVAVDVFPREPSSNADAFVSPLQGLDNVILTPHVGGSTQEAQERIGEEVARKLIEYSDVGSTIGAVNFPQVQLSRCHEGMRFIQVQKNLPGELSRLNEVFARRGVNIAAQYYETGGEVGYAVLDSDGDVANAEDIIADIRSLPGTIRARVLNNPG